MKQLHHSPSDSRRRLAALTAPLRQLRPSAFLLLVLTFILTGCDKDDCDFTPPPASLTVTITAYSLEDGSVLHTRQETIVAPTDDGTLAAQEKTYASPEVKGFIAADDQTVQLPAVGPGQQVYFSVSFFLPSALRLVEKSESKVTGSTIVSTETDEVIDFTFVPGSSEEIEVPFKAQSRIINMEEVRESIKALFPETKGQNNRLTYEEAIEMAIINHYEIKNEPLTWKQGELPDAPLPDYLKPEISEVNKLIQEGGNLGTATRVEIDRKYVTAVEFHRFEAVIQGTSYTVENIKVEVARTEITITYLNAGSSGQIGDWKPVTGEGVAD